MELEKFKNELKVLTLNAMKTGDKIALETYRSITNAILVQEKKSSTETINHIDILQTCKKQRMQSIAGFIAGGNTISAELEEQELVLIEKLLPQTMNDTELETAIRAIVDTFEAPTKRDMGKVIAQVKITHPGQDMTKVSKILNTIL